MLDVRQILAGVFTRKNTDPIAGEKLRTYFYGPDLNQLIGRVLICISEEVFSRYRTVNG